MGSARGGVFLRGLARHAWPRRHLLCQRSGGDVIDLEVVSDGEVTEGGKSDGARSAGARSHQSGRSGIGERESERAAKDSNPLSPPKSWRAREMQPHHKRRLWGAPFVSLGHRAPCP